MSKESDQPKLFSPFVSYASEQTNANFTSRNQGIVYTKQDTQIHWNIL